MLFKPETKKVEESKEEEKLLLQEVVNDKPKKINTKRIEEFNFEPPKFTD